MRMIVLIAVLALCAACATKPAAPDPQAARDLEMGQRVYTLHCARCHGPEGKDEAYPFIARLDGIGKRLSPAEILEATWASGFVSRASMNEEEQRCLGLFVATL